MIHLCSGDMGFLAMTKAGFGHGTLIWRDSPAVGPWHRDPARRVQLRARFWQIPESALTDGEGPVLAVLRKERQAALWFSQEPWDQMALLWIIATLAGEAGCPELLVVPLAEGGSEVSEASLKEAFGRRYEVPPRAVQEACRLWEGFQEGAWAALRNHLEQGDPCPALPWLAPALSRVLEDRPPFAPGRTERQIRELMAAGVKDLPGMMTRLAELEKPYGLAWYGDKLVGEVMAQVG